MHLDSLYLSLFVEYTWENMREKSKNLFLFIIIIYFWHCEGGEGACQTLLTPIWQVRI